MRKGTETDREPDEAQLRRVLDVCCSEAADRGTPISRAEQDLIIADAMKGTNAEFRRRLEESQKLLSRELALPRSYVDLMLANPVVSRLWFAIQGQLWFKRAVPGFRRVVAQEHAQEHDRHAEASKGLMIVAQVLMALPTNGATLQPHKPHPGGRPPNSERDAVVAEMREHRRLNPEFERLDPKAQQAKMLKHIRPWFKQTFKRDPPVRDTLLRYYKIAFD
jgi:hypothetical protein